MKKALKSAWEEWKRMCRAKEPDPADYDDEMEYYNDYSYYRYSSTMRLYIPSIIISSIALLINLLIILKDKP